MNNSSKFSLIKRTAASLLAALALIAVLPKHAMAYDHMTYLYGGTTSTYLTRMASTNGSINIVSPDYFEVNASGTVIYTKTPDPLLISSMHSKGIKVIPFLSNHFVRAQAREMLKNQQAAVNVLVAAVKQYDLDGLDIDIQNTNQDDRQSFSNFIALLRNSLPKDKELTVCVAANPWGINTGWQGGYDYAELAKHCNHVFMMTYDESYETSAPGSVSSLKFIEDSIKYGLKHVPKEKLMMGMPFYGRHWTVNSDFQPGYAWTIADIEWLVRDYGTKSWYDDTKECARATITIPAGSNVKTWGGTKIPAGTYDVWYENERSYEKKLALVRQYGLKGVGTWALGQEPSYTWNRFSAWLEGTRFTDITNHWATAYILELADENILSGRDATHFVPEGTLTRAEAAVLLCKLYGIKPVSKQAAFADTGTHWAKDYINASYEAQIVTGYSGNIFLPDKTVSREEFALMAKRCINLEATVNFNDSPFTDISKTITPWSNDAIIMLHAQGILAGYDDGTFRPKETIKRGEAAKISSQLRKLPARFYNGEILPSESDKDHMGPR